MRLSSCRSSLSLFLAFLLAGCGMFDEEDRAPWRAEAEAACFARERVKLSPLIQKADEIDGKGVCGLDRPLKVAALADGTVGIAGRPLTMSCPVTAALEEWIRGPVQQAAYMRFGMPVIEIKSMGTYNCRTRNNVAGARLSEHAFANAIDISGFVLADGREISVLRDWRKGDAAARAFLRAAHAGACGPFTTVLGPGSDGMHENHFHLDLARHNNKGTYRYCRPQPVMPPPGEAPLLVAAKPVEADPPPGVAVWPRVLPETVARADLPPPPVAESPAVNPLDALIEESTFASAQRSQTVNCPPGYICMPAPPSGDTPAMPPGWNVGPQPLLRTLDGVSSPTGYMDE